MVDSCNSFGFASYQSEQIRELARSFAPFDDAGSLVKMVIVEGDKIINVKIEFHLMMLLVNLSIVVYSFEDCCKIKLLGELYFNQQRHMNNHFLQVLYQIS
jgi:hypothetical protein